MTLLNNKDIGIADGTSYDGLFYIDGYSARSGTPMIIPGKSAKVPSRTLVAGRSSDPS